MKNLQAIRQLNLHRPPALAGRCLVAFLWVALLSLSAQAAAPAGTVTTWGYPSAVAGTPAGSDFIAVSACGFHSLALRSDGTVAAWGQDSGFGEVAVPSGLSGVVAISAGYYHNIALKSDGTVVAWGDNSAGQSDVPPGLMNVVAIAAGEYHNLALKSDGTLVAWGANGSGELTVPSGLSNIRSIAAGLGRSFVIQTGGNLIGWGRNDFGQASTPPGLSDVKAVAVGPLHTVALRNDGTVVAWGLNDSGETVVPTGLANVVAVAAGYDHSAAVRYDGTVVAWGWDNYGVVSGGAGVFGAVTITAGDYHNVVTVLTPWTLKSQVKDELVAVREHITEKSDSDKLKDAIEHLSNSLKLRNWLTDEIHPKPGPDGEKVFSEEKPVVSRLLELRNKNHSWLTVDQMQGFIDRLIAIDQLLAQIAINEALARTGDPEHIRKAQEELSKGDSYAAADKPSDAIEHYKNAWKNAVGA